MSYQELNYKLSRSYSKKDHDETNDALEKTRKKATVSKVSALNFLKEIGMVDEIGNLTPSFNHK